MLFRRLGGREHNNAAVFPAVSMIFTGPDNEIKEDFHATREGGLAIDFLQRHYRYSFPEAVTALLGGVQGAAFPPAEKKELECKSFSLPPVNGDMRRVFAYLIKQRHIDRGILTHFARANLLYEDAEYYNAVFVGNDEHGVPRHALALLVDAQAQSAPNFLTASNIGITLLF